MSEQASTETAEHAPKPWHRNGHTVAIIKNNQLVCVADCVADEWNEFTEAEAEANATYIVTACNAHEDLIEVVQCFFTWHANHFGDFGHDIDSELLCLANDAEAAIAQAERGE